MTDSPYLPDGRQYAWDSTSLRATICDRYYYYWQRLGYRPRGESVHLTFGLEYAHAMENYNRLRAFGRDHDEAVQQTIQLTLERTAGKLDKEELSELTGSARYKSRENLIRSLVWYFEEYRNDPCQTVILADGKPAVELSFRFQYNEEILFCGHLDRIVEFNGDHYIQDQKTTGASLGQYYFNGFSPDPQMSLYTIAAQVVWHSPVAGVMIDAAQIQQNATKFGRGFTFRTKDQNDEWLQHTVYRIERVWEAEKKGWPLNDTACGMYGGCPFRSICSKSPQVRDDYLKVGFEQSEWNPLETR